MKKTFFAKFALVCICTLFVFAKGKAQGTCTTAVTYSYPVTQVVSSYTASNYWFKVTTPGAGNYQLQVSNGSGTGKITSANIYVGSCASLTLAVQDSIPDSTYTSFYLDLYNTASTTYYVNLINEPGSWS